MSKNELHQVYVSTHVFPTLMIFSLYFNISFRSLSASSSEASVSETCHMTQRWKCRPEWQDEWFHPAVTFTDLCSAAHLLSLWLQKLQLFPPAWCLRTLKHTDFTEQLREPSVCVWGNLQTVNSAYLCTSDYLQKTNRKQSTSHFLQMFLISLWDDLPPTSCQSEEKTVTVSSSWFIYQIYQNIISQ